MEHLGNGDFCSLTTCKEGGEHQPQAFWGSLTLLSTRSRWKGLITRNWFKIATAAS